MASLSLSLSLALSAGQKYCRMLQVHSAILSTFIKLLFVIKILSVLSIFERPFTQVLLYFNHLCIRPQYNNIQHV